MMRVKFCGDGEPKLERNRSRAEGAYIGIHEGIRDKT
jgi:hypothetical protein